MVDFWTDSVMFQNRLREMEAKLSDLRDLITDLPQSGEVLMDKLSFYCGRISDLFVLKNGYHSTPDISTRYNSLYDLQNSRWILEFL